MTVDRIRGRRLQRIRQQHFMQDPLCVACKAKGLVTLAAELDHIQALANGGSDTEDNRQGLCVPCHQASQRYSLQGKTG